MQVRKTIRPLFIAGTLMLIIGSFSGCYYDNVEELYPKSVCDTTGLTFTTDIRPIMENNCAISGCHVAGGSGNGIFNNYDGVKAKVDNGALYQRVIVRKDMPPTQPLSECQQHQISAWINAGAPK